MTNAESMIEALAEPMRREILERLLERPRSVTELADGLPVTRPAVSQHLKVLKESRLVTRSRRRNAADLQRRSRRSGDPARVLRLVLEPLARGVPAGG